MHPLIKRFLMDYQEWLDNGASEPHYLFDRGSGLCVQLGKYLRRQPISEETVDALCKSFTRLLPDNDTNLPFNVDVLDYMMECSDGRCHLNRSRINWIKSQLESK